MNATTATEPTYYEVVWGEDMEDRVVYADEHDGTFLSATAEGRASQHYLTLIKQGVKCGLFVGGNLKCGENVSGGPDQRPAFLDDPELYAKWVAGELDADGDTLAGAPAQSEEQPLVHRTRTVFAADRGERYVTKSNGSCGRWVRNEDSVALCSCGWKAYADTRAEARAAARGHRRAGQG